MSRVPFEVSKLAAAVVHRGTTVTAAGQSSSRPGWRSPSALRLRRPAVDLLTPGGAALADPLLIQLVAIAGKGIGAHLRARAYKVPPRDASALPILLL